jgi:hypothetical protein
MIYGVVIGIAFGLAIFMFALIHFGSGIRPPRRLHRRFRRF